MHARLLGKLKASPKLFTDETTAPVLDPGRGKTKTGQLWACARDDRPWDGADPNKVKTFCRFVQDKPSIVTPTDASKRVISTCLTLGFL